MKKLWKRLGALLMTAALMLTVCGAVAAEDTETAEQAAALPGNAAITVQNQTIQISGVADGDVVTAYRAYGYDSSYNNYEYDSNFSAYVSGYNSDAATKGVQDYLKSLDRSGVRELFSAYAIACNKGTANFPAEKTVSAAAAGGSTTVTLAPGYYMLLVTTTESNNKIYKVMTVFIQVKSGVLHVYGGDSNTELSAEGGVYNMEVKSVAGPVISKKVYDSDASNSANWKTTASAGVGDTLNFYVSVELPNYTEGNAHLENLRVEDTMTNLSYVDGTAKVTSVQAGQNVEATGAITGVIPQDGKIIFQLDYDVVKNLGTFYITYSAVMQPSAVGTVQDGNTFTATNSAKLFYRAPDSSVDQSTGAETTTIYSYGLNLNKVTPNNDGGYDDLDGAVFSVYTNAAMTGTDGLVSFVLENGYYRPAMTGETGVTELPANADVSIRGLELGSYYIKEVETPSGYYKPQGGVKVDLVGARTQNDEERRLTGVLDTSTGAQRTSDKDNGIVGTRTLNGAVLDLAIVNVSSPILPTTGGPGTVAVSIAGVALMILGAFLFLSYRRKRGNEA